MTVTPGKIVVRDEVEPVRWAVEQGRFLLRGTDTGGLFSLMEFTTPPGGGPPLHLHDNEDETFYVTSGLYEFQLGDTVHTAGPGTVLYGPRGTGHGFRNISDGPGTMLCYVTPGGAETMFEELAELQGGDVKPAWEDVVALAARHHISYPRIRPVRTKPSVTRFG
ncbi:cupin domain-containing protein [Streptomyces sp. NPDC051162]|uniref:cupin domain-containing protein n=1 Tax=unclassified Streptomyces TaxID=2593676 RepID=UPI003448673F